MSFTTLKIGKLANQTATVAISAEWSPTTNPSDTPSYVNFGRVRNAHTKRGRDNDMDRFQAGDATLLVDNRDRSYDPLHATGTYFGNVLPERRVRLQAQFPVGGTTYDVIQGYADGWPQNWDAQTKDSTVSLSITDGTEALQQATLPNSMFEMVSRTIWSPDHWWKFDDAQGSQTVVDSGTNPVPGTARDLTFGSTSVLSFDGGRPSAEFVADPNITGIVSGFEVGPGGGMNLNVPAGTAFFSGVTVSYLGGTVAVGASDTVFGTTRIDLLVLGNTGFVGIIAGTAAVTGAVAPALPAGAIALATIYVPPSLTVLTLSNINWEFTYVSVDDHDAIFPTAPWPQSTTAWTVSLWFVANAQTTPENQTVLSMGGSGGLVQDYLEVETGSSTTGDIYVAYSTPAASLSYNDTTIVYADGVTPHHVAVTLASDTKIRIYVDGVSVFTSGTNTISSPPFGKDAYSVGSYYGNQFGGTGFTEFRGRVAHFQVDDGVTLTDQNIADLYAAGAVGLAGERTGTRVGRVLDYIGWSASDRAISTGDSILGAYDLTGGTALDYLSTLADTEQGMFYFAKDGKLTWRSRSDLTGDTRSRVSQATFRDSSAGLRYQDATAPYNSSKVFNDAQVTRQGGTTQFASDTTSIAKYRRRTYTKTVLDANDTDAYEHAIWAVNRWKDPKLSISQLIVKPARDPANLWPQVLGREIGDRVTFILTPQGVGSAINVDLIIEGIEHEIEPDDWTTTFKLSPAEALIYFIPDDGIGTYAANSVLDGTVLIGF